MIANITNPRRLKLSVSERSLIIRTLIADHPATSTTVVTPDNQSKVTVAGLAHGHVMVWHPHWSAVS